jgi:hypothetical protein
LAHRIGDQRAGFAGADLMWSDEGGGVSARAATETAPTRIRPSTQALVFIGLIAGSEPLFQNVC